MAAPQRQLGDEDRPQGEAPRIGPPFRRRVPMPIEDPFELIVDVFDGPRPQLVKDAPDLDAPLRVRLTPIARRHQLALVLRDARCLLTA